MSSATPVILHLRGSDVFGSPERLIIGQIGHLRDFKCVCASFQKPGKRNFFLEEVGNRGIAHATVEDNHLFDPAIPRRIRKIINDYRVNLLVSYEYKSNFYGWLALRNIGIPQIAYFHGWTKEGRKVRFYNWLDTKVLPKMDQIITVSRDTKSRLVEAGADEARIAVVYNAIDINPECPPNVSARKRNGKIGMIGRLSHEKGVHILLDAISLVRAESIPFKLEIYGDGPERDRLEKMAAAMYLDSYVKFMGFTSDIEKVYETLDFLIIPSLSEAHPLVILEAWKYGIGVIATRTGGIPEVVEDKVSGLLVDVDDKKALADAIIWGLRNPDLLDQYGRNGFELLKTKFSYDSQAEKLRLIYAGVLNGESVNVK